MDCINRSARPGVRCADLIPAANLQEARSAIAICYQGSTSQTGGRWGSRPRLRFFERRQDMQHQVLIVDDSKLARMVMAKRLPAYSAGLGRHRGDQCRRGAERDFGRFRRNCSRRLQYARHRWPGVGSEDSPNSIPRCRSPWYRPTCRTRLLPALGNLMRPSSLSL